MSAVQPIVAVGKTLSARSAEPRNDDTGPVESTLLDLVRSVAEVTDDDREVVATVRYMILSGRVRLCGIFRGASGAEF